MATNVRAANWANRPRHRTVAQVTALPPDPVVILLDAQYRLDPQTAAAGAGPRHARMTRAILRGYDLQEPDRTHAVRLLGSVFHGYTSLEMGGGFDHSAPDSDQSWTRTLDALDALLRHWPRP